MRLAIEVPNVATMPEGWEENRILAAHGARLAQAGFAVGASERKDFQDAVEHAAKCEAAIAAYRRYGTAVVTRRADTREFVRLDVVGAGTEDLQPLVLAAATGERAFAQGQGPSLLDPNPPYWESAAFARHAGRALLLCRNAEDDEARPPWRGRPHLFRALDGFAREHGGPEGRIAHKFVGRGLKEHPVFVGSAGDLAGDVGYGMERQWSGGSLLQGAVTPIHEYRFVVVGWRIVTGAATLWDMVPSDASESTWLASDAIPGTLVPRGVDTRLRGGGGVVRDAETVAGHLAFALAALADLRAEGLLSGDFTLDVFKDAATGRRGVMELNPVGLAGWYAADADRIMTAVAARTASIPPVSE